MQERREAAHGHEVGYKQLLIFAVVVSTERHNELVLKLANVNLPIDNPYISQIITGAIGAVIVIVVARVIAR